MYVLNNGYKLYIEKLNRENKKTHKVIGDLHSLPSTGDRASGRKLSNEFKKVMSFKVLKSSINSPDLADMCRMLHPTSAPYKSF